MAVFVQPSDESATPGALRPSALPRTSLLVLSDVHLGSDIGDEGSPHPHAPARSASVDDDLRALLEHYREARPDGDAWHLVINGDFIDFIGISIGAAGASISTEPSAEERAHGLGTPEDHACVKLSRVAERHRPVFVALAAFVAAGHRLTIVPGNHDREFHWSRVKDELRAHLLGVAGAESAVDSADFLARIQFSPWFLWVEGVAYIEHGDQYDAYCATDHVMTPLSPLDPRRLASGFSEVLLRFVVHRTRTLGQHGHDEMGLVDYVTLALRLGVRGGLDLARRFVLAIVELFRLRRTSLGEAAEALRHEHERRVAHLGEATRIGLDRLRALVKLQVPPITRSIRGILGSVLLDELALALLSCAVLVIVSVFGVMTRRAAPVLGVDALVLCLWWLGHKQLSRARHIDPGSELMARAAPLARLFPAAFVVMGHTHVPVRSELEAEHATYINTGSWAEDEGAPPDAPIAHRATRTHLVIRVRDAGPEAELLAWDSSGGPRRFQFG